MATVAHAQQRPLVTEDPETIGGGRVLVEVRIRARVGSVLSGVRPEGRSPEGAVDRRLDRPQLDRRAASGRGFYQRLSIIEREPAPLDFKLRIDGDDTSDVEDW